MVISVIVPFYNAENYLTDILNDLLQQTYSDMEILLIDDGSSDQSGRIAQSYHDLDDRICYIRMDHQGVSAARNIGIKRAYGTYIRFLDADDRIGHDSMEKMIRSMECDKEIDLVCGRFDTDCANIVYFGPSDLAGKISVREFIDDFSFAPMTFYYGVVWNKLYKREVIVQNDIRFDETLDWCEDYLFNIMYYEFSHVFFYLQDVIYRYSVRENSLNYNLSERIGNEKVNYINQYRYQKTIDLIEKVGCSPKTFSDTWAYLELLEDLVRTTSVFSDRSVQFRKCTDIRLRFSAFKELLSSQDNRDLLKRRSCDDSDIMVRIIYKKMNRKQYFLLFSLMMIKDYMSVHCISLKRLWRRRKRRGGNL